MPSNIPAVIMDWLFSPESAAKRQRATWIFVAFLFLGGLFLWGYFVNWGRGPFTYEDWAAISAPRLSTIRSAMQHAELPLHIANKSALNDVSDRFMSTPDVILSPQIVLLRFMGIGAFILLQTLLMYALGFAGLLRLKRLLGLSPFAFLLLFLLFDLNGHILAHFSVGHFSWNGYFLLSWLACLVIELLQGGAAGWGWVTRTALLLFAIFLQGAYHQFIYCLMFLALLSLCLPGRFWLLVKTAACAVLVSMVRVLPLVLAVGQGKFFYIGGYPLLQSFWDGLVTLEYPGKSTTSGGMNQPIGMWELTMFVGLAAALFLLYFGILRSLRNSATPNAYRVLLLPIFGLSLLSLSRVFQYVRFLLPVPPFSGERIAARFFSLALIFLLVLAVYEFQSWLNSIPRTGVLSLALGAGLLFMLNDLWQNFRFWRVSDASQASPFVAFDPTAWHIANRYNDTLYIEFLWIGLAVTLLSIVSLLWLSLREKHIASSRQEKTSAPTESVF